MSQQSFHQQVANGSNIAFTITTFSEDEIKVYVDGVESTNGGSSQNDYTIPNYTTTGGTVTWNTSGSLTAPANPSVVRVVRQTDVLNNGNTAVEGRATFQAGSSVKADDLNNNTKQALRALQEQQDQKIQSYDFEAQAVNTAAIKDSAVTTGKIANGAIVDADINASADIAVDKLANGTARQLLQTNAGGNGVEFTSNVDVPGTLDVTNAATFDSTVTIAGAVNVNNTTTLDNTTVDGVLDVNGSATIDNISIDGNVISTTSGGLLLDSNSNSVYLDGNVLIRPTGNTVRLNVTNNAIVPFIDIIPNADAAYDLGNSTYEFKDLYIDGTGYIDTVSADDITGNAVVTSGASTSDTKVYSAKRAGEVFYEKGTLDDITSGNTWVSDDSKLATTAAIDARVIDLVDDVGGFVPIANETSFPNANPDINDGAGTLVSVASLSTDLTSNSVGIIYINNGTVGNSTVTIVGAPASSTFEAGFGIIVETRSTLNQYTFHRYVPNATSVTTVASNLTNIDNVGNNIANVNNVGNNINNVVLAGLNVVNINSVVSNASNINTVAGNDANITTVAGINGNITTVAGNNSNVTIVANNNANITAVANKDTELARLGTADAVADMNTLGTSSNVTNMDTLAGISGNITTVAGISSNVTTVANDSTEIGTLVGNIANVNIVADNNSNVTAVAGNNSNITAVANNATNINAVANNASNINSAVSNASNINSAVSNAANITTVAGISSDVTTVAGIDSNVTAVAGNATNINSAVSNASNINSAVSNASNINSAVSNASNINTVAGNSTNINTVAGANSNISTVAGSIANVNTTASDIGNVNTVAGSISNVNTVGSNITNVTNASNYLNNFLALYLGQLSSDPVSDSLGNSVTEGDLYFNSNTKQLRIYNGSVFQGIAENAVEVAKFATAAFNSLYTASAGSNSIDLGGLTISGAVFSTENISANRVSLAKGSGTFNLGGI